MFERVHPTVGLQALFRDRGAQTEARCCGSGPRANHVVFGLSLSAGGGGRQLGSSHEKRAPPYCVPDRPIRCG